MELSPPAERPAHAPESIVYDFDYNHDPAYLADPHERAAQLVEEAPGIFWTPRSGGHWVALRHQAIFDVMLSRLPTFRSDPMHPPTFHGGLIAGVSSLHLVWDVRR